MAPDPWLSAAQRHDRLWVQLDAQLTAVTEAAMAEVLAQLWRIVLGERIAVTAAAAPNTDGLEQAARETWGQAIRRWIRPVALAAYQRQYGPDRASTAARDAWWADTEPRLLETADRLVQAVRDTIAGNPTDSVDQLRDKIARVLGLDAITPTYQHRIQAIEKHLTNQRLTVTQRSRLYERRVVLQADLFRVQAARSRSRAYLAMAQALPTEAPGLQQLARQAARSAADERRIAAELAQVDDVLFIPTDRSEETDDLMLEREDLLELAHREGETWRNTAQRIARTESTNVLNAATLQRGVDSERESGQEMVKTWLSADDDQTRPTHGRKGGAHGQTVALHEPFRVGTELMQRPGDPDADAKEVIQCRCGMAITTREEHREIAELLAAGVMEESMTATAVEPGRTTDELPIGWRGVIMAMNTDTGDRRNYHAPVDGVLPIREAPRSLLWQPALAAGHDGAVVVGNIAKAWIDGDMVMGQGAFDLESEDGREAARLLHRRMLNGVSADLDSLEFEYDPEADFLNITQWRIMTATMVAQPAFTEARIEPVYASDLDLTLVSSLLAAAAETREAAGTTSDVFVLDRSDFEPPELTGPTPLTVTADGRVFGHLALWGVCHVGINNACVVAPHTNSGYAYFHTGAVTLKDGTDLPVGKITLGGGHADPQLGFVAAAEHYDNVAAMVAFVRASEDEWGIPVAGRLLPNVGDDRILKLRAAPLSGDWRRVGGQLELVAALGVVVPGFPVPRTVAASADGHQVSLVAAGVVKPRSLEEAVRLEVRAVLDREERARRLTARLGLDPQSRAAEVAARVLPNE